VHVEDLGAAGYSRARRTLIEGGCGHGRDFPTE
jgi:hypothetical protein